MTLLDGFDQFWAAVGPHALAAWLAVKPADVSAEPPVTGCSEPEVGVIDHGDSGQLLAVHRQVSIKFGSADVATL